MKLDKYFYFQGISVLKHYPRFNQPVSGNTPTSGNINLDDEHATAMSTSFDSVPSPVPSTSQFVPNPAGIGPRSVPKRSTFTRTQRLDTSTDDLLHDPQQYQQQQQLQNEYTPLVSKPNAPQQIRYVSNSRTKTTSSMSDHSKNIRPPLIHGAPDSQNSSGQDSGLSSGGASVDPEQHHIYTSGNPTNIVRAITQTVDEYDIPKPIPIPKRKSLPSIVKTMPGDYKINETARSSDNLKEKETFIIENGIRKRVTAQEPTYTESGSIAPQGTVMTSSSGSPILARRVILESITKLDKSKLTTNSTGGNKRGSMPAVVNMVKKRYETPSTLIIEYLKIEIYFSYV